jgi:hypothetical protein
MFGRKEGEMTHAIEKQTSKVPSLVFLGLAGASVVTSLISFISGKKQLANFVGEWVPTLLMLGLYNKIVKEV